MERDRPPLAERIAEAVTLTSAAPRTPHPLDQTQNAPPRPTSASPAPFTVGARIGRYVLLAKLGEGGMGEVYSAFDQELERRVALKVVRASYLDAHEGHARIEREALALARLSHPNVVQIYDVGEHSGQVFVAMEYVKGETLAAAQARHDPATRAGRRAILDMYIQAGRGLAAAHAAGLVHRDFKPESTPPPTRTPISQQIGCNPTNSGVLAGGAFFPEGLRVPAVCPEPGKNQAKLSVSTRWCRRGR
jgi:hypothetical protein